MFSYGNFPLEDENSYKVGKEEDRSLKHLAYWNAGLDQIFDYVE